MFSGGRGDNRGLTLGEVVVALGLFAVAGIMLVGVFTRLLAATSIDSDLAAAEILVDSVLERAEGEGPPDWGFPEGTGVRRTESGDRTSSTAFLYSLEVTELERHDLGEIYRLDVEVDWAEGEGAGRGRQRLQKFRLVYVE